MPYILCIGPLLMDRLFFEADGREQLYPGGNAVIFSSVAARMGTPTVVLGQVGWDANGNSIQHSLEAHGVDTTYLHLTRRHRTKVASVRVSADGTWRKEAADPEHFPYLPATVSLSSLRDCRHLHVGGLTGLLRVAPAETLKMIETCREAGVAVSIGLAPGTCQRDLLAKAVHSTDLVLGTAAEFSFLLDKELIRLDEISEILGRSQLENCVITLGSEGALVRWRGLEPFHIRTQTRHAVSTVGAGDVFAGILVSALQSGFPVEASLRLASCAATLSVSSPTWDDWLKRFTNLSELQNLALHWTGIHEV